MNINKAITGLTTVAALTLVTAGATMAQTFGYTTVFSPNPVQSSALGNFITVDNGSNATVTAPSQINLSNFVETSNTAPPDMVTFSTPFTIDLTVTPDGGSAQTQTFTGTFSGQYNTNQTFTHVSIDSPGSLVYNFGSLGSYTFNNLTFVAPGPSSSTTRGSIGADVTYTPVSTVPEPATVAPFTMGALGLLALGFRARKTRQSGAAA